uniref:Putative HCaRG n=1 Tax=Tanacetum cinerariifolium TaxID=118510 RepID=A0A699JRC2_TANCI|nr:putative HCaRG [Tanacetum cinerariifolium]
MKVVLKQTLTFRLTILYMLLVCLRMLIRKCVCENANKDDIQKLIPAEVSLEIQRLLTLLQKFHGEWREDILKD